MDSSDLHPQEEPSFKLIVWKQTQKEGGKEQSAVLYAARLLLPMTRWIQTEVTQSVDTQIQS